MPTVVITGCSSGLGLEMVKQFAARGDKVFATCRKKESSASGKDSISELTGDITIIEGVDVAQDDVGEVIQASGLAGVPIDILIHNAGSMNGTRDIAPQDLFPDQKLATISMDRMRAAFEVNTLGPLRVQQALNEQMQEGGKVVLINTGFGSIADNGSGGNYAYRASKCAANMVTKNFSCDLKSKNIAVTSIAPGMVATEFGPGAEMLKNHMGAVQWTQQCRA